VLPRELLVSAASPPRWGALPVWSLRLPAQLLSVPGSDLPRPTTGGGAVRDAADRILARPEFDEDQRSLLERARDWVFDRLDDLLGDLTGGGGGELLAWAVVVLLTVAAVVFAVRFTRGARRDPGVTPGRPVVPRRTAAEWRAEAESHEAAGRWRPALRCRYRALVADLAARGLVEEVPGRTTGEYRRQVDVALPDVAPAFEGATSLFEGAWYGGRDTGADDAARFRELEARVLAGVS
jgi:hypothetical protein